METVWLENERITVGVMPAYGARVTQLVDRRTGRDWIATGIPDGDVGEDAEYLAPQAIGWDECFPTVARCTAGAPWNRRLRDHGELWGRPWRTLSRSGAELTTRYEASVFDFTRRLSVEGSTLSADYEVRNTSSIPMPYLWAMHLLLAVRPGDRIDLGSVGSIEADFLSVGGHPTRPGTLPWPGGPGEIGFDLDAIQPAGRMFAAKLYVNSMPVRAARLGDAEGSLVIAWSAPWNSVGLWLNYGGWPAGEAVHHIAIEPTTRPTDNIGPGAEPAVLEPGAILRWNVGLSLGSGSRPSIGGDS